MGRPETSASEPPSEQTQSFRRADVRALRDAQADPDERSRMDAELAAQRAALDATLRRPRDNRGNRKRRSSPPTAATGVPLPVRPAGQPDQQPDQQPAQQPAGSPAQRSADARPRSQSSVQTNPRGITDPRGNTNPRGNTRSTRAVRPDPGQPRNPHDPHKPRKRRTAPILAMLLVVLSGFALVVFGGLRATYLAPPTTQTATLTNTSRVPVLATQVGLLGLEGPRTRVTVRSASSSSTVFLGIGRAADVDAYLADANRLDLVGVHDQDQLLTRLSGTRPTLPDPAGTDVWVVSVRAKGAATLVWPNAEGQWRLIAASDGKAAAPAQVEVTWSGRPAETLPPVLIAIGFVLMVAGGVTLVMISSRRGLDDGPGARGGASQAPDGVGSRQPSGPHFREGARL